MPQKRPTENTESSKTLLEFNVEQLIQFILKISQFSSESDNLKMNFNQYFKNFVESYTADPSLRDKLYKIPYIRPDLDPDSKKMLTMQAYNSAIIQFILNELFDQEHAQFFKIKELEQSETIIQQLLNKSKEEAETQIDLETYKQNLVTQQNQMENMAMLAISLSLKERITFLEKHQLELFNEISESIYTTLKNQGAFNNLKDVNGNLVILSEQTQRNIVNNITKDYINGLVDYQIKHQAISLDEPQNLKNAQALPPRLYAYQSNANNLFEKFHNNTHAEKLIRKGISNNISSNIAQNSPEMQMLVRDVQNELKNNKKPIINMASIQVEIMQNQAILKNINDIKSDIRIGSAEFKAEQNRFKRKR